MAIVYSRCKTRQELLQILELQRENLPGNISNGERASEGFLTVVHDLGLLNRMNLKCAHMIAMEEDVLTGYALCMHPEFEDEIPVLKPMFEKLKSAADKSAKFMVMGQICVRKSFRRKGVFRGLYNYMKDELSADYDSIITEVDAENTRSLNAHHAIGFKDRQVYNSGSRCWHLIQWYISE